MNIPADEQIMSLAKEGLAFAGHDYTPEQLTEIPKILATKNKYWWCVDMQLWDMMPEVYVEPFEFYSNGHKVPVKDIADQVKRASTVCDDSMVPIHMGHNRAVHR